MKTLKFKLLHDKTQPPEYQKEGDSGFDLAVPEDCYFLAGETRRVNLGIAFEIPEGYELQLRPRSSVSQKGILSHFGTIDQGYRGEVAGLFTNLNRNIDVWFRAGERVAQAVLCKVERPAFCLVPELAESERGDGGFGHTGRF